MPVPLDSGEDEDELYRYYPIMGGPCDGGRLPVKLGTQADKIIRLKFFRSHIYQLCDPGGGHSPYYKYQGVKSS